MIFYGNYYIIITQYNRLKCIKTYIRTHKPMSIFRKLFYYLRRLDVNSKNKMAIEKAAFIHSVDMVIWYRYIIGTYLLQIWRIVKNVCSTFRFWMSILVYVKTTRLYTCKKTRLPSSHYVYTLRIFFCKQVYNCKRIILKVLTI